MSVFNKRTVMVDGIRVEVLEAGSGEPLVYLHGAGSTSGFQDLFRCLSSED
jgi:pimeloyl-ACP methyl ester carboxylesterase